MSNALGSHPRLKHTSPVFRLEHHLYIGGYGEVSEIPDPGGQIGRLLELLDGTRDLPQVCAQLSEEYPGMSDEDVRAAVAQLDESRFLEDASVSAQKYFGRHDVARWERNINFFGSYARLAEDKFAMQRRLTDARVALLGLGGLGSHLLLDMAAMGVGHVRAVDFDQVELSNLNRQILYREDDIGLPKLGLAVQRVAEFNPAMDIEPVSMQMGSVEDVAEAIGDVDLVVCVADRPKMEIARWVNQACVTADVPFVTGGLETQRAVYYTVVPGWTGCVECWRCQVATADPVSAALLEDKRRRGFSGDKAAFCPLVTMTTGLILGEVTRLLTGIAPPVATGRLMELQFDDYGHREVERWEMSPDCTVCRPSANAPATTGAPAPAGTGLVVDRGRGPAVSREARP